jgi:hypothetical protein
LISESRWPATGSPDLFSGIGGAHPSSLTAVSKKTAKRRAKARRKKANHRRKPNAR